MRYATQYNAPYVLMVFCNRIYGVNDVILQQTRWLNMEIIKRQVYEACKKNDISETAKSMGYARREKFERRLTYVLNSSHLGLAEPNFDGLYSSEGFLNKLLSVLDLEELISSQALQEFRMWLKDGNFGYRPWLFVETNFKRRHEAIFILAFGESLRRLNLSKSIKFMTQDEQCEYVRSFIVVFLAIIRGDHAQLQELDAEVLKYLQTSIENYRNKDCDGTLVLWGKPVEFYCHLSDNNVLKFDLDGHLLKSTSVDGSHGGATVTLRGNKKQILW